MVMSVIDYLSISNPIRCFPMKPLIFRYLKTLFVRLSLFCSCVTVTNVPSIYESIHAWKVLSRLDRVTMFGEGVRSIAPME